VLGGFHLRQGYGGQVATASGMTVKNKKTPEIDPGGFDE
jgi:hypothetical protein